MKRRRGPPRPVYRKPRGVPFSEMTDAEMRAWTDAHNARVRTPAAAAIAETFGEIREKLAGLLRAAGAEFYTPGSPLPIAAGYTRSSAGGLLVRYRTADAPPEVPRACEALDALRDAEKATGEARVLAVYRLGRLVERVNVEALLAEALDSYRRSHQRAVTDDQIRKAVASHKTRTEAAAELGITTRQLQTRCRALGLLTTRNRKPTSSDTR